MNGESQRTLLKSHPVPARPATAPGEITLHEWKPGEEWVTHFHNLQDGGYYYGHYFRDLESAEADYEERVRKELGVEKLENISTLPVQVPLVVFDGLNAVRETRITNMFDVELVKIQAVALGLLETAEWIEANRELYYDGICRGFESLSTGLN